MLDYHDIHIMLCQFSLPAHLVIKRSDSFMVPEVVELMKLKFSVYIYTMGPLEQAYKRYRQHDYRGAKKSFVHCLRYLMMAIEVARTRKPLVKDHTVGNCYHEEVFARFPEGASFTWDELLGWYTPLAERYMAEFKDLANAYKLVDGLTTFAPGALPPDHLHGGAVNRLATTAYMRHRRREAAAEGGEGDGLAIVLRRLREELSVTAHPNRHDPTLVHFTHCSISSPPQCPVVSECCGLVLQRIAASTTTGDSGDDEWRIACLPFLKMWSFTGLEIDLETLAAHAMDWDGGPCRLWEKPVGISACLFYHQLPTTTVEAQSGEWLLTFSSNNFYARSVRRRAEERVRQTERRRMGAPEWDAMLEAWFWAAWRARGYALPDTPYGRHRCFMFRFVPPLSPAVGACDSGRVVLTGVRGQRTLCEEDPTTAAAGYGWECARERSELLAEVIGHCAEKTDGGASSTAWPLQRRRRVLTELRAEASKLSVVDAEGFVLCDQRYSRIGLPSLQFAALSDLSPFHYRFVKQPLLLAVVRASFHDQQRFARHYPEWREWFEYVADKLRGFARTVGAYYGAHLQLLSDRELAQRLKQLSKPLQSQRKHLWKQRKRNQKQKADALPEPEPEPEPEASDNIDRSAPTERGTDAGPDNDDDKRIRQFGDLSRLFWAIRRREQQSSNAASDSREGDAVSLTVLECLVGWEGRTDGPFTHKLEEWLWKADNSAAVTGDKDKLVRMRHASHRPTTLLRREEP